VEVLLRVYAKCIVGQDKEARRRVEEAFRKPEVSADESAGDANPPPEQPEQS